jgi:hypothetical protein
MVELTGAALDTLQPSLPAEAAKAARQADTGFAAELDAIREAMVAFATGSAVFYDVAVLIVRALFGTCLVVLAALAAFATSSAFAFRTGADLGANILAACVAPLAAACRADPLWSDAVASPVCAFADSGYAVYEPAAVELMFAVSEQSPTAADELTLLPVSFGLLKYVTTYISAATSSSNRAAAQMLPLNIAAGASLASSLVPAPPSGTLPAGISGLALAHLLEDLTGPAQDAYDADAGAAPATATQTRVLALLSGQLSVFNGLQLLLINSQDAASHFSTSLSLFSAASLFLLVAICLTPRLRVRFWLLYDTIQAAADAGLLVAGELPESLETREQVAQEYYLSLMLQ